MSTINKINVNGITYDILGLPVGTIFTSALPQTNSGVHLLDGSYIATNGVYSDFCQLVKKLVEDGYNLLCSEAEFKDDVELTGSCGKFVLNEEDRTLRLPKITTFIQGLSDLTNIGKAIEAGLPNITGTLDQGDCQFGTYNFSATGSFYNEPTSSNYMFGRMNGSENKGKVVYFDASKGETKIDGTVRNDVYGKSNTVQPASVTYPYYIVLATVKQTDIEVNIDNIVNDLNNKVDKNSLGIQIKDDYVNGTSGYRIWNNGYCEQWGNTGAIADYALVNVTLLKAYRDTNYNITTGNE